MIKIMVAPLLLCAAVAGFSTQASAVASKEGKSLVSRAPIISSCSRTINGGRGVFTGFVWGTVETYSDRSKTVRFSQLRIQQRGGEFGRSKANFEAHLTLNGSSRAWLRSGDNLRQDNVVIPFDRSMTAYHVNGLSFKFVFDQPGPDPRCTAALPV